MSPKSCGCGCGTTIRPSRKFVNKEHHLRWMANGGAAQMNAKQSLEDKRKGGASAGRIAAASGQLAAAGLIGAERARVVAEAIRMEHDRTA